MTKLIRTLFIFFLFCSSACAETIQSHHFGPRAIGTAAATNYFFVPVASSPSSSTEANMRSVASSAGTVIRMMVMLSVAPDNGAGSQTVTVAMRINGSTGGTSCTITEANNTCETDTTTSYSAGNAFAIIQTAGNTPAASTMEVTFWTVDSTNLKTIIFGGSAGSNLSASVTNYYAIQLGAWNSTEAISQIPMPFAGTISALYVLLNGSPDNGAGTQSYTFKIYIDGAGSTSTCTISETGTTCNDTANNPTFTAGQTLTVEVIPAGTPTVRKLAFGIAITNTVGGYTIPGLQDAVMGTASAQYRGLTSNIAWDTTETVVDQLSAQMYLFALYADVNGNPDNGAGTQSYTFTIRDDAAGTTCTCAVSETTPTCNDPCADLVSASSQMAIEQVPANTPTARTVGFGIWAFINPRRGILVQ